MSFPANDKLQLRSYTAHWSRQKHLSDMFHSVPCDHPPAAADAGVLPIISLKFYWAAVAPDLFCLHQTAGHHLKSKVYFCGVWW